MTALYLTEPGTTVRYRNESLVVTQKKESNNFRLAEVSLVVVLPGVQLTDVAIAQLLERSIETIFLCPRGQFRGRLQGQFAANPTIRIAQYRILESAFAMALAQKLVAGKIHNQRVLLQRRNRATQREIAPLAEAVELIAYYSDSLTDSDVLLDRDQLMGIEGICARTYYKK